MQASDRQVTFQIDGLDCAEEANALRREVGPVVGGEDRLSFDLLRGRMTVDIGEGPISVETIRQAVARTGMRAEPCRPDEPAERQPTMTVPRWRTWLTVASGVFVAAGFAVHIGLAGGIAAALGGHEFVHVHEVPWVARLLYGLAIVAGFWLVLPKAWYALRRLQPDMNLLMTIAVAGAVAIGEWFEGAMVAFLFALSLALESWTVARAQRAIAALLDLMPPTARWRRPDGREELVPPDQVPVGGIFVVRPGERVPLDGVVRRGSSHVNQAPITGESMPVSKQPGDDVFAGSINGDGALEVESTKPAGDTTVAHIIRLVRQAQSQRSPAEQWVDRFARWYTPTVIALAVIVLIVPTVLFDEPFRQWLYNALVLLVVACPCALVISTPVSIVAALTAAARQGVLVKGGAFLEEAARLRAIALDKTGTLTQGKAAVVRVTPLAGHDRAEVLERAAALEARTNHPVAQAILACAENEGIRPSAARDLQIIPGKGATATLDGRTFWIGSHRFLEERGQETDDVHRQLVALAEAGTTVVVLGNDEHVCGMIALADQLRPHVPETLRQLHELGIKPIVMLTGDNAPTARAIAAEAGVDEVRAELLPGDKVEAVADLVRRHGHVAMVGDGVNDAPALARATLGVAMGAAGSDAALETADVALMADDLTRLPWLIRHGRRTLAIIRQNITFALATKAAFVALTFAGLASLWMAIAADTGASLLVIANGLRLLRPSEP